jgi:hypothetical protein
MDWFSVDKEGLARLMARKGKASVILELLQNAWDEDGTTEVDVRLESHNLRGHSLLVVTDNAPNGFSDLTHAFTLFAPSKKVHDATKAGRFNMGDKQVLALCRTATVVSTRGGYEFTQDGRRALRRRRDAGSEFSAVIRLTAAERDEVAALVATLIPPAGITTVFNGTPLPTREPVRTFTATLRTEVADAEGVLRPTRRQTQVRLYEPAGEETPHIYELGIPVVAHDSRWHVDISQKVPLSFERNNVTPAYLRELRVAVLNATADLLTSDDTTTGWVKDAVSDDRADAVAVEQVVRKRFGEKVVAYDPSDPEANAEAVLQGYTVVHGRTLSKDEWAQTRRAGALKPAGQVTPSRKARFSADGKPPTPRNAWTPGMERVAEYAQALARDLLDIDLDVQFHSTPQYFAAAFGDKQLTFNLMRLGHRWFNEPDQQAVDALLIHEFAHHRVSDHLSEAFHDECCRLGARLRDASCRL